MRTHRLPASRAQSVLQTCELECKAVRFYDPRLAQLLHCLIDGNKSQNVGRLQCSGAHPEPFDFIQLSSEIMSPNISV